MEDLIMLPIRRTSQDWLPSIFNDLFENEGFERINTTSPAINVIETAEEYKVEVAAPGMTKENFAIRLTDDNLLYIYMEHKEEKKEDKKEKYLRREFSFSKFEHSLILPDDIVKDKIAAQMKDGVLTIHIPKVIQTEKEPANRIIDIQ